MPSSRIRLAGLFTFVLALTGCAATDVSSYVAHGVDLQAHHTYNWATVDARSTGDPRLDNNRFFEERVQAAIEKQLASLGFRKTADQFVQRTLSVTCFPARTSSSRKVPCGQRPRVVRGTHRSHHLQSLHRPFGTGELVSFNANALEH